jgi:hypothetical protein
MTTRTVAFLLPLLAASACFAQQVVCAPSVAAPTCRQFDAVFGAKSIWPLGNFTKNVEIVIVDPAGFKAERQKLDAQKDKRAKAAKTVGDINRAGSIEAGSGVFDHEILEANRAFIEKIIISTEALDAKGSVDPLLGDQLLFYVLGYDQGNLAGVASQVP